MEKTTRDEFQKYAEKHDWFPINESGTPDGKQDTYLTPAGEVVIVQYNLKNELFLILKPSPAPAPQGPPRFPFIGKG